MVCFPPEGATQNDDTALPTTSASDDKAEGLEAGGADVEPNNAEMRDLAPAEAAKGGTDDTAGIDAPLKEPATMTASEEETVTLPRRPPPKATAGATAAQEERTPTPPAEPWFTRARDWNLSKTLNEYPNLGEVESYLGVEGGGRGAAPGSQPAERPTAAGKIPERKRLVRVNFLPPGMHHEPQAAESLEEDFQTFLYDEQTRDLLQNRRALGRHEVLLQAHPLHV